MFKTIAYNTGINFIAKITTTALGLIAVVVMTRYLGVLGFGQYTIIITYLQFFGLISDMGLTLVTSQLLAKHHDRRDDIIANLLTFRLLSATIFLGLAPLIVIFMPYAWPVKLGVFIATASFLAIALNQVFIGFYQERLLMVRASWGEVVGRIVLVAAVVVAVWLDTGLQGIVIATTIAALIHLLINYLLALPHLRIRLHINRDIWREIIQLSWPIAITITFNIIYLKADTLILSLWQSEEVVGVYGAAYRVIDSLVTLPFILAGIALPQLTHALKAKNTHQFNAIMQHAFDLMVVIALPLVVGAQFVADDLMRLVAGNEFAAAGPALRLLIVATAAIYLGVIFSHAIIALDRQKQTIWAYAFVAVTALVGYLIFIPRYSYVGAAAVTIYSEVAIALLIFGMSYRYTRFVPRLTVTLKVGIATVAMALALHYTTGDAVFSVVLGTIVYGITLYAIARQNLQAMLT